MSSPYSSVAACVEPGEECEAVVAAARHAHGDGEGPFRLVHVAPPAAVMRGGLTRWETPAAGADPHDAPRRWLQRLARRQSGAEAVLLEGEPPDEVAREWAERTGVRLLVCGAGRSAAQRAALGAFAEGLARRASCPVLVAREGGADAGSHRHVACCLDTPDGSHAALREARQIAAATGARLSVLHVVTPPIELPRRLLAEAMPVADGARADARRALDAVAEEGGAEPALLEGDPAGEILRWAGAHEVGLLVAGRSRGGAARLVLGSVAATLLREAPCPVLVAPSGDAG